ncbi:hypothetical protein GCM10011514_50030 [Emticicia aquatilis]|uniref:AlgX/AlgJ SGNH hydrolase-like domain-containing protein n=2 Tax=Emticicia aquatilis TaxID=1537369 RepID=A0A916Z8B2_9BACT|nr:hypothetical protein GCM10011514_50030 [Emticicia aquatilis]
MAKWLHEKGITQDDYRYGDLYRMSNLAKFKAPLEQCPVPQNPPSGNTSLIIMGDSFTEKERLEKNHFKGLNSYNRFFITDTIQVKLDTSKRNVLIIETVERHFRERFTVPYMNLEVAENETIKQLEKEKSLAEQILNYEVPYNTERHESILFSSDFFLTLKEWKAWLNWKLFDRLDEKVMLSKDEEYLLYQVDAQPSGINSCFDKISEKEIQLMVDNLNKTYQFYKNAGFDEVYLSIIPNKTSILGRDLGEYNHLIERIQKNSALKMPFFDIYTPYHNSKKVLYEKGDSHWNCEGKQMWLDLVNAKL